MGQTTRQPAIQQVAQTTGIRPQQIEATLALLEEGNTIPFIARYRKEVTGSLDEVQINDIQQAHHQYVQLTERKADVIRLIGEQDKLTPELQQAIDQATTLQQVEDLYRPYKQTRRTKAMIAKEQGLEPLAEYLLDPEGQMSVMEFAQEFISEEVPTVEEALLGAHEIIAQQVGDRADFREFIRKYTRYNGELTSKGKQTDQDEKQVYQMYYDYSEKYVDVLPHRVLALNRGEKEDILSVKLTVAPEPAINYMAKHLSVKALPADKAERVQAAIEDGYKRFIEPSIERELRNDLTAIADQQAITVFGDNLRHLLLQPPIKGEVIMGFDPAYRTGCKIAIINETGEVLDRGVIYPHKPASQAQRAQAPDQLVQYIQAHGVDIIAIGNGTASRESEQFVSQVIQEHGLSTQFVVVNEAGASVYSASKIAREEFPDFQVEERSAVSIARRLQDPLAELIKIDPKAIGVGQYQHDVPQKLLSEELDFVVNITVNQVGVDLNTASVQLLEHVSGLTKATANNIIERRNELGHFSERRQLQDVKRLGPKTYEQAAGFLRVVGGANPLDQTGIHPESYGIAEAIVKETGVPLEQMGSQAMTEALDQLDIKQLASQLETGAETVSDIIHGLKHPTEDIRDQYMTPTLRSDVLSMEDLSVGMQLEGVVRNVVDFGAFVDIGVKQDGLIHISRLAKQFIKHPSEVVSVGDVLEVEIVSLDLDKERIGLKRVI